MDLAIVIPTYNEAGNIEHLVKRIFRNKVKLKLIIVDDNSPDGTGRIVKKLQKKYPNLILISRKKKSGLGTAYIAGFSYVLANIDCKYIMSMDADFSHNPSDIPRFMKKIDEGYEIVVGSRYVKGGAVRNWGPYRRVLSRTANFIAHILLNIPVHDLTGAFRCYRKKVIKDIELTKIQSQGYSFLEEILFLCKRKKFRFAEIPIIFEDRTRGASKLSKKEIVKFFFTVLRLGAKRIVGK